MKRKRALCMCLALMFLILLFAGCSAESDEKALLNTNWVSVFYKSPLILNEDGTGVYEGSDMRWTYQNNQLLINYEESGFFTSTSCSREFNMIKSDGYYILQNSYYEYEVFVPEEKYEPSEEKVKNSMISNAREISFDRIDEIKKLAIENEAKAEEIYLDKSVKITGIVTRIDSYSIGISETAENYESFNVYMLPNQITKLNKGDEVTIIGMVSGISQVFSQDISNAFVLE